MRSVEKEGDERTYTNASQLTTSIQEGGIVEDVCFSPSSTASLVAVSFVNVRLAHRFHRRYIAVSALRL